MTVDTEETEVEVDEVEQQDDRNDLYREAEANKVDEKTQKQTANIENWSLIRLPYTGELVLEGVVSNHKRQVDFQGPIQRTSSVIEFDLANNRAETRNTVYTLGKQQVIAKPDEPALESTSRDDDETKNEE